MWKRIGIGIGIISLIFIFGVFLWIWRVKQSQPVVQQGALPPLVKEGEILLEGYNGKSIVVKDFISDHPAQNMQEDRFLSDTSEYSITYVNISRQFFIAFSDIPSLELRMKAEDELLQILGISRSDACGLNIYESVPKELGDEYSGANFGFSSCPDGRPIR